MFVRLAFAICTAVQPDIVVMDEMIGAGDQSFIKKAQKRLENVARIGSYPRLGISQRANHTGILQQGALA